ncbi:MAG: hypothetical protein EHM49_00760 [Deltaproteobacteria bacterium]|nr:MAG: hypothetical protein EHM49_00760 [Deltaproteobacteria bacterium]
MPRDTHTTNDEKQYLNGLGSFCESLSEKGHDETKEQRRIRLLQNYIESTKGRRVWNRVSSSEVIDYAHELLRGMGVQKGGQTNETNTNT